MEIRGHGGITHFGNSEGRGGSKYGSRPWYGMDIFYNRPFVQFTCISQETTQTTSSLPSGLSLKT